MLQEKFRVKILTNSQLGYLYNYYDIIIFRVLFFRMITKNIQSFIIPPFNFYTNLSLSPSSPFSALLNSLLENVFLLLVLSF